MVSKGFEVLNENIDVRNCWSASVKFKFICFSGLVNADLTHVNDRVHILDQDHVLHHDLGKQEKVHCTLKLYNKLLYHNRSPSSRSRSRSNSRSPGRGRRPTPPS